MTSRRADDARWRARRQLRGDQTRLLTRSNATIKCPSRPLNAAFYGGSPRRGRAEQTRNQDASNARTPAVRGQRAFVVGVLRGCSVGAAIEPAWRSVETAGAVRGDGVFRRHEPSIGIDREVRVLPRPHGDRFGFRFARFIIVARLVKAELIDVRSVRRARPERAFVSGDVWRRSERSSTVPRVRDDRRRRAKRTVIDVRPTCRLRRESTTHARASFCDETTVYRSSLRRGTERVTGAHDHDQTSAHPRRVGHATPSTSTPAATRESAFCVARRTRRAVTRPSSARALRGA